MDYRHVRFTRVDKRIGVLTTRSCFGQSLTPDGSLSGAYPGMGEERVRSATRGRRGHNGSSSPGHWATPIAPSFRALPGGCPLDGVDSQYDRAALNGHETRQ